MIVKFGWKAGSEQYPPQQLLEYAVAAEQAGFESIDVSDHFHPWSEQGQACFVWRPLHRDAHFSAWELAKPSMSIRVPDYGQVTKTRQAQLREAIQLIRALWKGDPVS